MAAPPICDLGTRSREASRLSVGSWDPDYLFSFYFTPLGTSCRQTFSSRRIRPKFVSAAVASSEFRQSVLRELDNIDEGSSVISATRKCAVTKSILTLQRVEERSVLLIIAKHASCRGSNLEIGGGGDLRLENRAASLYLEEVASVKFLLGEVKKKEAATRSREGSFQSFVYTVQSKQRTSRRREGIRVDA